MRPELDIWTKSSRRGRSLKKGWITAMEKIFATPLQASVLWFSLIYVWLYDLESNAAEQITKTYLANLILCDHSLVIANFATLFKILKSSTIPMLIRRTRLFQALIHPYHTCLCDCHISLNVIFSRVTYFSVHEKTFFLRLNNIPFFLNISQFL